MDQIPGLTVTCTKDGTWLEFHASTGERGAIRVESAEFVKKPGIVAFAAKQWCRDRQREAGFNEAKQEPGA